jgi:hypothetical protein
MAPLRASVTDCEINIWCPGGIRAFGGPAAAIMLLWGYQTSYISGNYNAIECGRPFGVFRMNSSI